MKFLRKLLRHMGFLVEEALDDEDLVTLEICFYAVSKEEQDEIAKELVDYLRQEHGIVAKARRA